MISYRKLLHLLVDQNLKLTNVVKDCGLSSSIVTKINQNRNIEIESLEKICLYLNVDIGDICEIHKD